uniref:RxLR effector protein n=2 Tax=Hyaloperonospora arabidopsidis (strain Emoy2) TaxID=559515 RepID=M4BS36_HYAAE|nr:RxLR effector candidate protein [Hyaloperonospora arabidopsidis Emoy2]
MMSFRCVQVKLLTFHFATTSPHSARLPHDSTIDEDTLMRIHVRVLLGVAALVVGIHTTVALVRTETTNEDTQLSGRIHSTGDNDVSCRRFLRTNDAHAKDEEERVDTKAVSAWVQKVLSKLKTSALIDWHLILDHDPGYVRGKYPNDKVLGDKYYARWADIKYRN